MALVFASWVPSTALAAKLEPNGTGDTAQAESTGRSVTLELVVNLGEGDEAIGKSLAGRITAALEAGGIAVTDDADRTLVVDLHWAPGTQADYVVWFDMRDQGAEAMRVTAFDCNHCTPSQFWEQLDLALVERVVPGLQRDSPSASEPGPEAEPAGSTEAELGPLVPTEPQPKPSKVDDGPMFYTGLGMLALGGGVALGASIVLVIDEAQGLPKRPTEWGLFGAGFGVAAIGAVLVGVARCRPQKRRRVSISPGVFPSGLTLSGRF